MTARQVEIVEALYHNSEGTMTPADLSEEVGLTRSSMTGALDSLEKLGYITRMPHPSDRRMIIISLTSSGQQFINKHLPERYRRLFMIVSCLSSDERAVLLEGYKKVIDLLVNGIAGGKK